MDPISPEELEQIFEYVEQGDLLKPRLARLKGIWGRSEPLRGMDRKPGVEKLLSQTLAEKSRLLQMISARQLVNILNNVSFKWVSQAEYSSVRDSDASWVKNEVMVMLGDIFREELGDYSLVISALMEATYGMTRDYDMVWYLLSPLMDIDYDPESVVLLRENGIEYLITETEALILDHSDAAQS
ncbi:hypothetical protein BTA51_26565 [Hahella sp. CCB-MM4]|nr:hypothetical protein BTA51_26565 [Hahella sp. CCB-MM4]